MDFIEEIINIFKEIIKAIKKLLYKDNCQKDFLQKSFKRKEYLLTPTELKFYKILKEITDELQLNICPQVALYEIINTNNYKDFNKISRKSIDFVITEPNLKILCCMELDDYTHNRQKRIKRDIFLDTLFKSIGIKLYHVQVRNNYNKDKIKNAIMGL